MNQRFLDFARQTRLDPENAENADTPLYAALDDYGKLIVLESVNLIDTLHESYSAPSTAGQFIKNYFEIKNDQ